MCMCIHVCVLYARDPANAREYKPERLFLYTLVYLTLLFAALVIDAGPLGPQQTLPLPIFQSYFDLLGTSL